jgi:hypothetical protein
MREVVIRIRDDLDQESLADATVLFSVKGVDYEIDLTSAHESEFDADVARWIAAARIVPRAAPVLRRSTRKSVEGRAEKAQRDRIKAWGRQQGFEVGMKGLPKQNLIDAYAQVHPEDPILEGTGWVTQDIESVTAQQVREAAGRYNGEVPLSALIGDQDRLGLSKTERSKVRRWAIRHRPDLDQAATGQIKGEVLAAYNAAHERNTG